MSDTAALSCSNCACWTAPLAEEAQGMCIRYPGKKRKHGKDYCFEHQSSPPDREVLGTELELLPISPRTRKICKNVHLRCVDDVLMVGRLGITLHGVPDVAAIRDLVTAMKRLGISW